MERVYPSNIFLMQFFSDEIYVSDSNVLSVISPLHSNFPTKCSHESLENGNLLPFIKIKLLQQNG